MTEVFLIRHGKTISNVERRYMGKTDLHLCQEGIEELLKIKELGLFPDASKVYTSPMFRCRETASILFPQCEQIVSEGLREMDFGAFEGRSYPELKDDPAYIAWTAGMCEGPVPGGEDLAGFKARCRKAFYETILHHAELSQQEPAVFVVHGGTIMALMSELARSEKKYYEWYVENGHGYRCSWNSDCTLQDIYFL